jgi:hypothetical protein
MVRAARTSLAITSATRESTVISRWAVAPVEPAPLSTTARGRTSARSSRAMRRHGLASTPRSTATQTESLRASAATGTATTACGGDCVDLQTDPLNCSVCGHRCLDACVDGACSCAFGGRACGDACVDVQSDELNCGECFNACPDGVTCTAGVCPCEGGATCGRDGCVDLMENESHCGGCYDACVGGSCEGGVCICASAATRCDVGGYESCANLQTDPSHCGWCGHQCSLHQTCVAGVCTGCEPGFTACVGRQGEYCADTQTDPTNCGTCGRVLVPAALVQRRVLPLAS